MKKIVSLLMCLCLLLGCCGALADGAPITWLTPGDTAAEVIEDGDRIVAAINEQLGIELNVQYVPEGNIEKVNVAMASGDFPDIVTGSYGSSATNSWIENGMLVALNDYAESLPNIAAWLEKYSWSAEDGVYYGMPFITQYNAANALIIMRQDWLDNLDLAYPATLDEMAAVLHAFTYSDPDQDGQDNTYGFTAEKPIGNFNWVFYAYGRQYSDYELDADGNVIPYFESECFVPGMEYIKALWDDGVIDPEFLLNDGSKVEEKFYQGKAGAMIRALYRHVSRHENNLKAIFPEGELAWGLPPVGPDGESFGLNAQGRSGMFTAITVASKNPDKAAAFLDFMVSPEGNDLLRLGIEGIHYTQDGDTITFNEDERAKDAFSPNGWAHALAWGSFYWPLESHYLPATEPNRDRALQSVELATEAQVPSLIKQMTKVETEYSSALNDIFNQYFLDMLQGNIGIEEGVQQLIADWHSQGGDELLAGLNEAYQASLGAE